MSRQTLSYSASATVPRQTVSHGTSSAFSSSANPDEDWTQISDLAERRRIQNRIAQRNYRKKLKRRLEDLERRAGSSSASPPQVHAQIKQPAAKKQQTTQHKPPPVLSSSNPSRQKISPRLLSHHQYTPPMDNDDQLFPTFKRDGSNTPPLFAYHQSYPPPEESIYPAYPSTTSYRPAPTMHPGPDGFPDYLVPAPMTLPSMMHFNEALRRESLSNGDDALNPFAMSYAAMAGLDVQTSQTYGDSNPHTPPLSHSFDHSAACSDAGFPNYPGTPLSMPPSPPLLHGL